MASRFTPSQEDYLETIYDLSQQGEGVRVTDIAASLGIAKSSVHLAVHVLKDQALVTQEHYGHVCLTPEGLTAAALVRQKHNAVLTLLSKVLCVDPVTAEEEACKIEHLISDDTFEKIVAFTKAFVKGQAESS